MIRNCALRRYSARLTLYVFCAKKLPLVDKQCVRTEIRCYFCFKLNNKGEPTDLTLLQTLLQGDTSNVV